MDAVRITIALVPEDFIESFERGGHLLQKFRFVETKQKTSSFYSSRSRAIGSIHDAYSRIASDAHRTRQLGKKYRIRLTQLCQFAIPKTDRPTDSMKP